MELLARQLPLRMLGTLLGVPPEDGLWLVRCGDAFIGNADPEVTDTPVGLADTDAYRLLPFRSPVSLELLLRPTRDGTPLSDDEFKNFFTLLVAAGNDTTRNSITAGMLALLEHPAQLAALRDELSLVPSAVEEMLRWDR